MITKDTIILDLKKVNNQIKKKHRYPCGLIVGEGVRSGGADFFFESPDGQNGELYWGLRKAGFEDAGYRAQYFWTVKKDKFIVSYVEGDIYIKQI